jgi:hypothetical protein
MSRSNAAAINRRVNIPAAQSNSNLKPGQPVSQSNSKPVAPVAPQQTGFTLPQAISVIDTRLVTLERFMRETKNNQIIQDSPVQYKIQETSQIERVAERSETGISIDFFNQVVDEFNERFSLFAQEISDMKDIVLKLQTYTMDVNKTLLEERIQVFSDLNSPIDSSLPENNLVTLTSDVVEQNSEGKQNSSNADTNTSIDLKNLIKQEFLQSESN